MRFSNFVVLIFLLSGFQAFSQNEKWKDWETEGDTLLNHEDYEAALKLYSRILDVSKPDHKAVIPVFYKRAVCYYSLNKMAEALKDLNIFIPENPGNLQAYLLRAFAYKELGETDLQLADLNRVLIEHPENTDILKWRASVLLDKEDYAGARKDLLSVQAIQDDAETEMYLGMTYYYSGHADSAMMHLNKAIEFDVTSISPYLYAASFCLQEEQYDLVLKYVNVALKIDPQNTSALFYKGIALVELKNEKEGCRYLSRAFAAGEDDAADYLKEHCYGVED